MRPKPLFTRVCLAPARLEPHWSRVLVVILLLVSQFSHISPVVLGDSTQPMVDHTVERRTDAGLD